MNVYGIAKLAKEQGENDAIGNAALGLGGLASLGASKDYVLGRKTLYHGTSKQNAEKIKQEGLLAAKGGSGAAKVSDLFKGGSNEHVHATSMKPYAKFYANLADKKKNMMPDFQKIMGESSKDEYEKAMNRQRKNIVTAPFLHDKKESEILKLNMPYADYNERFGLDADGGPVRYMAGKTKQDVDSKYIKGGANDLGVSGRLKETATGLPSYIKKHPGRFGLGMGLATLGGTGLYQSVKPERE